MLIGVIIMKWTNISVFFSHRKSPDNPSPLLGVHITPQISALRYFPLQTGRALWFCSGDDPKWLHEGKYCSSTAGWFAPPLWMLRAPIEMFKLR